MKEYTRKLIKNSRGSYYLNVPKEIVKKLKWRDNQKIALKRSGKKIITSDWEK